MSTDESALSEKAQQLQALSDVIQSPMGLSWLWRFMLFLAPPQLQFADRAHVDVAMRYELGDPRHVPLEPAPVEPH